MIVSGQVDMHARKLGKPTCCAIIWQPLRTCKPPSTSFLEELNHTCGWCQSVRTGLPAKEQTVILRYFRVPSVKGYPRTRSIMDGVRSRISCDRTKSFPTPTALLLGRKRSLNLSNFRGGLPLTDSQSETGFAASLPGTIHPPQMW